MTLKLCFSQFFAVYHLLVGAVTLSAVIISPSLVSRVLAEPAPSDAQKQATVRFEARDGDKILYQGSGVIIARNVNKYIVLTVDHNFEPNSSDDVIFKKKNAKMCLITYDMQKNDCIQLNEDNVVRLRNKFGKELDLALVSFTSTKDYKPAPLSLSSEELDSMSAYGWPASIRNSDQISSDPVSAYSPGRIYWKGSDYQGEYQQGYVMRYDAWTAGGMSGGPVFDSKGRVIGIHGLKTQIEVPDKHELFSLSNKILGGNAAIPINTFVDQIPPNKLGDKVNASFNTITASLLSDIENGWQIEKDKITIEPSTEPYRQGFKKLLDTKFSEAKGDFESLLVANKYDAAAAVGKGIAHYQLLEFDAAQKVLEEVETLYDTPEGKQKMDQRTVGLAHLALSALFASKDNKQTGNIKKALEHHEKGTSLLGRSTVKAFLERAGLCRAVQPDTCGDGSSSNESDFVKKAALYADETPLDFVAIGAYYYDFSRGHEAEHSEGKIQNADRKEAFKVWDKAIKDYGGYELYLKIGEFLHRNRDNDTEENKQAKKKALEYWEELETNFSGNAEALRDLSETREKFGYKDEALKTINKAIALKPDDPELYIVRGKQLKQKGDTNKALDDFKKAQELYAKEKPRNVYYEAKAQEEICKLSSTDCSSSATTASAGSTSLTSSTGSTDKKTPPSGQNPPDVSQVAISTSTTVYLCNPTSGNVTLKRTSNEDRRVIQWIYGGFGPSYAPEVRCQQVSGRIQKYQAQGILKSENITYGTLNQQNVLCIATTEAERKSRQCTSNRLLITLEQGENPEEAVRQMRNALFSSATLQKQESK
jgi:tetratricopeptide (TPR) repeat protein